MRLFRVLSVLLLLSVATSLFAEIVVVTYLPAQGIRRIATCYQGEPFVKVKDWWPAGDSRAIKYYAVPDTCKQTVNGGPGWVLKWTAVQVMAWGDSLSADSTYVGRFEK